MPNWKISDFVRNDINSMCSRLTQRRVDHACGGFPLTVEDIQTAIIKPEHLKALNDLKQDGVQGLPSDTSSHFYLSPDYMPDLEREAVVHVDLRRPVLTSRPGKWWGSQRWEPNAEKCTRLDTGSFSDENREALALWTNRVVKERRTKRVVDRTVEEMTRQCTTVGHILAWCPMLATLVTDEIWKQRFQHPPQRMGAYAPTGELVEKYARYMKVAEVVLIAAQMMSAYEFDDTKPKAHVAVWKSLPNDAPGT